jgi:hypothetical protein
MKTQLKLTTALAACALMLAACGTAASDAPRSAAVQPDAAATKAAMAKEEAMKKEELVKAEVAATKEAMAKEDATKKEEMVKAEAAATKEAMAKEDAMKKEEMAKESAGAMMLAKGEFTKIDATHFASGQASIDKSADGKLVLRFANFASAPGPDLYVVLSEHPQPAHSDDLKSVGELELGQLQNINGDQEYALPDGFDASKYKSVVIYCKRFSFVFSSATLGQ